MAACGANMDVDKEVKVDEEKKEEKQIGNWFPLESNPDLVNKFAQRMGMPKGFSWADIWGFDDELLAFVPQPVIACVLLFPSCKEITDFKAKQAQKIKENPQHLDNLFYITQHDDIGNACGTIALIHALANTSTLTQEKGAMKLLEKEPLHDFIVDNMKETPAERGWNLLKDKNIQEQSDAAASDEVAQTARPAREDKVAAHFIAFVPVNDTLYELDGRKLFPINHGKTTEKSFLKDTTVIVKQKFMKLVPNNPNFNLMALSIVEN